MFKEYDDIKDITGVEESVCACKVCIETCKICPCLGTPTDILNIVKAGHQDHLVFTKWAAGIKQGIPVISMIQPYYDVSRGCCTFLDVNQKNCTLHDAGLKPTEGKLSNHALGFLGVKMGVNLPIAHAVALTWQDENNVPVIMEIVNELKAQKEAAAGNEPNQST